MLRNEVGWASVRVRGGGGGPQGFARGQHGIARRQGPRGTHVGFNLEATTKSVSPVAAFKSTLGCSDDFGTCKIEEIT
jgi:hypothetical protein